MRSAEGARVVETTGEGLAPESGIIASRDHAGRVKVLVAAGARPNFVKVAPLMRSLRRRPLFGASLIHTGQHDDPMLSSVFFEELEIPRPEARLEISAATHAEQTAEIMRCFEPVVLAHQPHIVVVVGDVNSTLACALVAAKCRLDHPFQTRDGLRWRPLLVHVVAGLRSFDPDMPEEVNRRVTDALSDLLFVSEPAGLANLQNEGVPPQRIFLVGNVMIDSLLAVRVPRTSTILRRWRRCSGHSMVWPPSCLWSFRSTRARGLGCWPSCRRSSARAGGSCRRSAIGTSFACSPAPGSCSPIPGACRRRRQSSAFPA